MSLSGRVSAFFLVALACVLLGFSTTLYISAQTYLNRQLDERLDTSMSTLIAAVKFELDGLVWDPSRLRLTLGVDQGADQIRWLVRDLDERILDRSPNLTSLELRDRSRLSLGLHLERPPNIIYCKEEESKEEEPWSVLARTVNHTVTQSSTNAAPGKYVGLTLMVATSRQPIQDILGLLAWALIVLSIVVWLVAALLGRWLCRRALVPVTQMAISARTMSATHWEKRLPIPQTGDELEDLGNAFDGLLNRLHEAFERQRQFTGDASHQLHTPLTALLGQIEVTLRRERSGEEYKKTLEMVQTQAIHLRQIVQMLLFLARADAESEMPNLAVVELNRWMFDYRRQWSEHARFADLHFLLDTDKPLRVRIQPPLFGQLLDNLIGNACKYSKQGSPITIRLDTAEDKVICIVEDAGCGISKEDQPHVFEPFYRSAQVRRQGYAGVGLGLAIVQRIASAFRGTLGVESEPGHGSRFIVKLPEIAAERESEIPFGMS